jgi:hypothetical protein
MSSPLKFSHYSSYAYSRSTVASLQVSKPLSVSWLVLFDESNIESGLVLVKLLFSQRDPGSVHLAFLHSFAEIWAWATCTSAELACFKTATLWVILAQQFLPAKRANISHKFRHHSSSIWFNSSEVAVYRFLRFFSTCTSFAFFCRSTESNDRFSPKHLTCSCYGKQQARILSIDKHQQTRDS